MTATPIASSKRIFFAIGLSAFVFFLIIILGGLTLPDNKIAWKALGVLDALTSSSILAILLPGVNTFNRPSIKVMVIGLTLAVGVNGINYIVGNPIVESNYLNEFGSFNVYGRILYILIMCVLAPISEEIYFRGLLLPILSLRMGTHIGAIVSAALFILAHMSYDVILMTIIYTYLVCRSKSVFTSMLAHISYNSIWMIRVLMLQS